MRFLRGAIARKLVYDDATGAAGDTPSSSEGAGDQS
jgi:hypothetical protein